MRSFAKKYILPWLRNSFLIELALLPPGHVFALLYNIRAIVALRPIRVAWTGSDYIVTDRTLPNRQFRVPATAHRRFFFLYNLGLKKGALSLGHSYHLHRIKFAKGDIVLDCGAYIGDIKLYFDISPAPIRYIGFEPAPNGFACLAHNAKGGDSEVHNIGLWKTEGSLRFYFSPRKQDSSFIKPRHYDSVMRVPARPLAEFMPPLIAKHKRVRLLKLEAEGAEMEVLEGLGEALAKIDYIAADLGLERGVAQEATFMPVANYLVQHGFVMVATGFPSDWHILFKNTRLTKK